MTAEEINDLCTVFLEIVRQADERKGVQPDPAVETGIREVFNLAVKGLAYAELVEALVLTTRSLERAHQAGAQYRTQESAALLRRLGAML